MTKEKIEKLFRSSNSSEELFDAFNEAIKLRIDDEDLYKILLANSVLTNDEIKLFIKKLLDEFPSFSFSILMWCVDIFANKGWTIDNTKSAIECLEKSIDLCPEKHEPLIKMLSLYNHEITLPYNNKIIENIKKALPKVKDKSKVYYAISKFYEKEGKERLCRKYERMAEKYK